MRHPQATTNQYGEALEVFILVGARFIAPKGSNEANILRVDIDTVVTWSRHADLELAW